MKPFQELSYLRQGVVAARKARGVLQRDQLFFSRKEKLRKRNEGGYRQGLQFGDVHKVNKSSSSFQSSKTNRRRQ